MNSARISASAGLRTAISPLPLTPGIVVGSARPARLPGALFCRSLLASALQRLASAERAPSGSWVPALWR
jgi:hypothetical protein